MCTKFGVPKLTFDHVSRGSKTLDGHLSLKIALGGRLRASGDEEERQSRDLKLNRISYFGPNYGVEFEN